MPSVVLLRGDAWEVRGGYLHYVGAVFGQSAGAGGAREHTREVEDSYAGQRPGAFGQRFGRTVADLLDLQQGQRGYGGGLRVSRPLCDGAHHSARAVRGDDGLLQFEGVPPGYRAAHGLSVFFDAKYAQRGVAVVGEVAVEVAPASVHGRIHAHNRVSFGAGGLAVHRHVLAAAQGGCGVTGVDANLLAASSAELPQVGGCESYGGKAGSGGLTNPEGGGQNRVRAAAELNVGGAFWIPARYRKQCG